VSLWDRTYRDEVYGCWLWSGSVNSYGYPTDWSEGKPRNGKRVAWALVHGPVPAGLECDHLCRERLCVRPAHMELVSRVENQRRKFWRGRVSRSRCPQGHDLYQHGRRTPHAGFVCLLCAPLDEEPPRD
jgi:hypothetical protein